MDKTWPTKKLGETCESKRGSEPGSKTYNNKGEGIRFIRVADISKQRTSPIWTTGKNLVICKKDDILMTFDGSPGVVFRGIEGAISSGIRIIKPKDDKKLLDDFLFYVLQTDPVQNTVKKYTIGVSIWHAGKSIPHIEIPLPPLKIQKRIVARIEELFEKIDKAKELRQMAQEETAEIFTSAVEKAFNKAEKKWGVKKLSEVCRINPSKTELKNVSDNLEVSFIPMTGVDDISGSIIAQEKKSLGKVKKGYTYFKEGDVLFAKITPCMQNGKSAIAENLANGIGFGSTEFHILRPLDKVLSKWIYFFIRQPWFRKEAERHFTGTAGQQRVPQEFLEKTEIPIPSFSEQKKIVAYLDTLREKVEKLKQLQQKQLEELTELKQSLLQQAFGGQAILSKAFKGELCQIHIRHRK